MKQKKWGIYQIIIAEMILGAAIILSIIIIKFFFKETFTDFKKWYKDNVLDNTYVSEVLGENDNAY